MNQRSFVAFALIFGTAAAGLLATPRQDDCVGDCEPLHASCSSHGIGGGCGGGTLTEPSRYGISDCGSDTLTEPCVLSIRPGRAQLADHLPLPSSPWGEDGRLLSANERPTGERRPTNAAMLALRLPPSQVQTLANGVGSVATAVE